MKQNPLIFLLVNASSCWHVLCQLCVAIQCVQEAIDMLRDNSHNRLCLRSLQVTESTTIRVPIEDRSRLGLN